MVNKTSRRRFLKRSASVVAGSVVLPFIMPSNVFGRGGHFPPSDRIVMGAIGTGSQGMSNMIDFLRLGSEVRFVAVCDVDTNHLAKAKDTVDKANKSNDCKTYGDFR